MAADRLLAIDAGTSALKLLLLTRNLEIAGIERIPVAGLDVPAWITAIRNRTLAGSEPERIAAIAVTGQMHGLVPWDGDRFGDGIPWTDQRGAEALPTFNDLLGPDRLTRFGGPAASGFLGVSLAWLRARDPERLARIQRAMLPKDALAFALTGVHATDPSDAVGTGLYDVANGAWATDVLHALGMSDEAMPGIVPSGSIAGEVTDEAAAAFGLRAGTPVITAGGDAAAGALGAGATREGEAMILLSTGAQVILPADAYAPDPQGRWYTWPAAVPDQTRLASYLRAGTLLNAGITTTWVREALGATGEIAPDPTALLMLPHLIGERTPLADPLLRGAILGISPATTRAETARAALEGIAFSLRHALETMTGDAAPPAMVRLGGGGANDAAWQRIITDVLGIPTVRIATPELSTFGAALLGAHALGWVNLGTTAPEATAADAAIEPDAVRHARYGELYAIYREAVVATAPIAHRLAAWREAGS